MSQNAPWKCPDCQHWIAPYVTRHKCDASDGANVGTNGQIAQDSFRALTTKDGRQRYNQGYEQRFLDFWEIYPLHKGKRKALNAWRRAIKRAPIDAINAGALAYRNNPKRDPDFTKYAEGWLNGDRWLDEEVVIGPPKPHQHSNFTTCWCGELHGRDV